ncbi:MAG: hypothetical protein UV53_C0020G0004 [Candidatus Azambacteria bacterium GW2011_GWE1_42_9]|nr:MAG: hypothetical protein UU33_C0001G0431 [Candidatus Azambacteria bacterium GW2011_GWF1_41_10]KKS49465.1 MAG: hypothetical protein UV14_C0001G0211 [Candidatus Azambacteria bacterium GW2011_GWF2_42_22]KKS74467.1 MAG: hypothetical protein UV45_C0003G0006 [Candidatus Azambacteria bacterium GW2011_GWB1_42_72]KKS78899.1 MAG: hypothetical protein UV53_C0020G0004 [Candidatus Azambacteria bacterium GW2011_GWE1_42_9]KKT03576.1 MAG: hypothetical protein UV81_C0001G0172 [Candidatus Azambacteria bacter
MFNLGFNIQNEYKILVCAGADGGGEFLKILQANNIPCKELKHLRRSICPIDDLLCVMDIAQIIKNFAPDIVFISSSKAGALGTAAAIFCRWFGRKFTLIYRIDWAFNDPRPALERKIYIVIENFLSKFRDIIIQNDQFDLRTAKINGIKPKLGFKIIHNGIDGNALDFLDKNDARNFFHNKLNTDLNQFDLIIGTIANYYKTKGLSYLLDAMAELSKTKNIGCILVGDGPERKILEKIIKQRGLENRVFLAGQISDAYKYLKACDIFVLPSAKEGFPWTILEAMLAGLPIIATKVGAIPEILENGVNGWIVESENQKQIVEKILWFSAHPDDRHSFGISAKQRAKNQFALNTMLSKYRQLFRAIIDKKTNFIDFD